MSVEYARFSVQLTDENADILFSRISKVGKFELPTLNAGCNYRICVKSTVCRNGYSIDRLIYNKEHIIIKKCEDDRPDDNIWLMLKGRISCECELIKVKIFDNAPELPLSIDLYISFK